MKLAKKPAQARRGGVFFGADRRVDPLPLRVKLGPARWRQGVARAVHFAGEPERLRLAEAASACCGATYVALAFDASSASAWSHASTARANRSCRK